jgi:hypothetical protein
MERMRLTQAAVWKDLEDIVLSGRSTDTKGPIVCGSTDNKYLEQVNSETGSGLMGASGRGHVGVSVS